MVKIAARLILYGSLGIVILAAGGLWGLHRLYSPEKIQRELEKHLSNELGRPVSIESVEWSFFPSPWLIAQNLTVYENNRQIAFTAPLVHLLIFPKSFKHGGFLIKNAEIVEPKLHIRLGTDEANGLKQIWSNVQDLQNWKNTGKDPGKIPFRNIEIRDARLFLWAQANGQEVLAREFVIHTEINSNLLEDGMGFRAVLHGTGKDPWGIWRLSGRVGDRFVLDGSVRQLPLKALAPFWPNLHAIKGTVDINGWLKQEEGEKRKWYWNGEVASFKIPGSKENLDSKLSWSQSSEQDLTLKITVENLKNTGLLKITIPNLRQINANFDFHSSGFDLAELLAWIAPLRKSLKPKGLGSWTAEGRVYVDQGSVGNFLFEEAVADLKVTPRLWRFTNLSGSALDGDISGTLEFTPTLRGIPPYIQFSGIAKEIKAIQLFGLAYSTPALSGRIDIEGQLRGPVSKDFFRKADGRLHFEARDGEMENFPTALKIISSLNLKSAFRSKKDRNGYFAFTTLSGTLDFNDGNVSFNNLRLESKTLFIKARGAINLIDETVDTRLSVQALTLVDEVLQRVPIVSKIYTKTKSIVPLWAHVKGRLNEPDVAVVKDSSQVPVKLQNR